MRNRILMILLISSLVIHCFAQASGGQIRRQESKPTRAQSNNRRSKEAAKPKVQYECRFAIFKLDVVARSIPALKKAKSEIESLQKKYEKDLESMQNEFTLHNDNYEKSKKKLSKKERKTREEQLQTMYLQIQQYYKDSQADIEKQTEKKWSDIYNEIGYAGQRIMNRENIVDVYSNNGVYYWNPEYCLDITNVFIKELGGSAYVAPVSFKYSDKPPKIGYVISENIPGFNPNENNEFQQSNWERLKRLSKMIADSDGYICIVDASQLSSVQAEYAVNVTYKLIEKFKQ